MQKKLPILALFILFVVGYGSAKEYQRGQRQQDWSRGRFNLDGRRGVPDWNVDQNFKDDVFTFARIRYTSYGRYGWRTDYPDADLNLSFRLQEMTSLKVDPDGVVLSLTDPNLFDYPFIYMVEPGGLRFSELEVERLREYLNRGGFMMVDDFWGEAEWENFAYEMRRVFPDRQPVELPLSHPIFNIVYRITEKPIVPSIHSYRRGWWTERPDANEAHYRAIYDDQDRVMVMICHNTDLGDGWEREGVDLGYFKTYSEKFAYPLAINIITYAMTH